MEEKTDETVAAEMPAPPNGVIVDDELGYSLRVAERLSVAKQLRWWSAIQKTGDRADVFDRYWIAARELIEDWKCETLALDTDLDKITDPAAAKIIMRVGLAVYTHVLALEAVPKK
jgi:hypothetical protein